MPEYLAGLEKCSSLVSLTLFDYRYKGSTPSILNRRASLNIHSQAKECLIMDSLMAPHLENIKVSSCAKTSSNPLHSLHGLISRSGCAKS